MSEQKLSRSDRRRIKRQKRLRLKEEGVWYPKFFWPSFAAPATFYMVFFFVLPFYAIFAVAMGTVDPIFRTAVPVWNPLYWNTAVLTETWAKVVNPDYYAPAFGRTFVYVIAASLICIIVGYPVAYFVARFGGRRKNVYLMLLIAPFWISYMMRMLAWVNILQPDGYLNKLLAFLHLGSGNFGWLQGHGFTVTLGLVYGYIPYMILPLFAGLDRIDQSHIEASRDLGASSASTFWRVTLPLSKNAILAGLVIVTLPMFGDYYTNNLLSRRPTTNMIGNLIDNSLASPSTTTEGTVLVIFLSIILLIPMIYYLRETSREAEGA